MSLEEILWTLGGMAFGLLLMLMIVWAVGRS